MYLVNSRHERGDGGGVNYRDGNARVGDTHRHCVTLHKNKKII